MVRVLSFVSLLATVCVARCDHWDNFQEFMSKFNKKYFTTEELTTRFETYRNNMDFVVEQNQLNNTYTLGETVFADLTLDEFHYYKNNYMGGSTCQKFTDVDVSVPSSIDWREKGAVTGVKDQGQCGSCWSFSATGAMEGAWYVANNNLVSLSEQQLVDCSAGFHYGNHGCNGGLMDGAFQYAIDNGMCQESEYSYTAKSGTCTDCKPVVFISSCVDVTPKNEVDLEKAVAIGPVSVAIEADTKTFQMYKSGVITGSACGTNLDHGVLVVGYGTESTTPYWLVKNSWGATWGEDGYVKIEKSSSTNTDGTCGIAIQPSYPVV